MAKTTTLQFYNRREAEAGEDIPHDNVSLHKQEYYDSIKKLRDMYGTGINIPFGELSICLVQFKNDNIKPFSKFLLELCEDEHIEELIELLEEDL